MVTKLDRLLIFFWVFWLEMYLRGRMLSALCFSPAAEIEDRVWFPCCPRRHGINVKHKNSIVYSVNSNWNFGQRTFDNYDFFLCVKFELTRITQILVHIFKSFGQEKSTQDEKVRYIKENELKVTQLELILTRSPR